MQSTPEPTCVTYFPAPVTGRGPSYSCSSLLGSFPAAGLRTVLVTPRLRVASPPGVEVRQAVPRLLRALPRRATRLYDPTAAMARQLRRLARELGDRPRVAYFWPDPPVELVRYARERGFVTVREMINSTRASARQVLDAEYRRLGLEPGHGISPESVARELEELAAYDYIVASNPVVEASLAEAGVPAHRIVRSTFGWSPDRFPATVDPVRDPSGTDAQALYVGRICVRKGAHLLLDAWLANDLPGTLTLAGHVEPALAGRLEAAVATGRVRHLPYVDDVNRLYRSSDLFVFPTLEEGGPQVTYEAAGCGLPIVTTPAGAARLVVDDETGYVVDPSVESLGAALTRLVTGPELRARLGAAAADSARRFTYDVVGRERAEAMRRAVENA